VRKGELIWGVLSLSRVLQVLHNPRYAGAFAFGRTRTRTWPDGRSHTKKLPMDEWQVLIPNHHEGYITWEEYQDNQRRLRNAAQAQGTERRKSPPREGPALLQGLAICGVCGKRMTVRYHERRGVLYPDYVCQRRYTEYGEKRCQHLPGKNIDEAIARLLLETLTPINLEVALGVQQEILSRQNVADEIRAKQVERAQYDADLAGQRYRRVDPNNRLVANTLETEWNAALRTLQETYQELEHHRKMDRLLVDDQVREQVMALTTDFPRVWNDPHTAHKDRKRMVRLLVDDVTLIKSHRVTLQVRFRGGTTQTLIIPAALRIWEMGNTPPEVVQMIDSLLNKYTDQQVANILNERGLCPGKSDTFHRRLVARVRREHGLKSRYERLRVGGMLTADEMAEALGVCRGTVMTWRKAGLLRGHVYNAKNSCLFEPPGPDAPTKLQGQKLADRRRFPDSEFIPESSKEVQYEA